ncbi:MAG: ABC transporter permease [Bacilli bacterium]
MKKFISNKYVAFTIGIIVIFLLWWIVSLCIEESIMIFPNPLLVFQNTFKILGGSYIYKCIGFSFLKVFIGFIISFILALIFGIIAGNFEFFYNFMKPIITTLKAIPTATLVFFFLVLVGAKNAPILMVILLSFPIIYDSIASGIKNIDKDLMDNMLLDGGKNFRNIMKLEVPLIYKYILLGISSSFALSFKIEIMAEILTGNTSLGLGSAILAAQRNDPTNMIPIFSYSLITIIFVLIISFIFKKINSFLLK